MHEQAGCVYRAKSEARAGELSGKRRAASVETNNALVTLAIWQNDTTQKQRRRQI